MLISWQTTSVTVGEGEETEKKRKLFLHKAREIFFFFSKALHAGNDCQCDLEDSNVQTPNRYRRENSYNKVQQVNCKDRRRESIPLLSMTTVSRFLRCCLQYFWKKHWFTEPMISHWLAMTFGHN